MKSAFEKTKAWVMRWGRYASNAFFVVIGQGRPLSLKDRKAVTEAVRNSAAVASVRWIQRNFSEAPVSVGRIDSNDIVKQTNSRALKLLRRPNEYYSGLTMMKAVVADYIYTGNAYIIKGRTNEPGGKDGRGLVRSLWWAPSYTMRPMGNENDNRIFIDYYEYTVDGEKHKIDKRDIIHFRDGMDPDNPLLGLSGVGALIKELSSDNEASFWKYALLKNSSVPPVLISGSKDSEISKDSAEQIKTDFVQRSTGDQRGMPMVLSSQIEVKTLSFDPKQMDLRALSLQDEERITAIIGVPPSVVGLGAGKDSKASYAEAREAAYESCMIPLQQDLADTLNTQYIDEFHNPDNYIVFFDVSKVRVLQPDINALHVRARGDLLSGLITLNQALKDTGREPIGEAGDVRFVPNGVSVVQLSAPGNSPTETPSIEDDINGDPQGGAPDRDDPEGNNRVSRSLVVDLMLREALGTGTGTDTYAGNKTS